MRVGLASAIVRWAWNAGVFVVVLAPRWHKHTFRWVPTLLLCGWGGVRTSPNAKTLNPVTLTGVSIAIPRNSFLARGRNVLPNCAAGPNEPNDSDEDSDDSSSTET